MSKFPSIRAVRPLGVSLNALNHTYFHFIGGRLAPRLHLPQRVTHSPQEGSSMKRPKGSLLPSAQAVESADHQPGTPIHQSPIPHFLIANFSGLLAHSRHLARAIPPARRPILEAAPRPRPALSDGRLGSPRARHNSLRLRVHRTSAKLGPCENYPTLRYA
jgi:hypothetical protein